MRPAAAFLAALWLLAACKKGPAAPGEEPQQHLEGFHLSQSTHGKPDWDMRAKTAVLLDGDKTARLSLPELEFFKRGKKVSTVVAEAGVIRTDTHDVTLSTRVVVRSLEDGSTLATEELRYSAERKLFVTEREVVVVRPSGRLRGTGLEASPDLSDIRIFNQRTVIDEAPGR